MTRTRSPTILIDASDIDRPSGGRTAVFELFRAIFTQEPDWRYIILLSRREPDLEAFAHVRQIIVPVRKRLFERLWVQAAVFYFVLFEHVDLVHFARTMGGIAWPAKNVLTIFDITTLRHPELHAKTAVWFWRCIQPWLIRQTDYVIAITQNVADDIIKIFGLAPEKIEVVYCAPQAIFNCPITHTHIDAVRRQYHLHEHYILFVGLLAKKKNLSTLIQALHILKTQNNIHIPLVLAGSYYHQSDDSAIFEQICTLGLEADVSYIGPVQEKELPGLFGGADVFVFPSLHEGFGIPCLEAMACQLPVVAARSGAIPEVVGDAALLVDDPLDAEQLAYAICQVLTDGALRRKLIEKGTAQVALFSWPRLAEQVLELYCRVMQGVK